MNPYESPSIQSTPNCADERCPSCKCEVTPPDRKKYNLKFSCGNCGEKLFIGFGPVVSRTFFWVSIAVVIGLTCFNLIHGRNLFMSWAAFVVPWLLVSLFYVARYLAGSVYRVSDCLLYTSPSPRDRTRSRMPSSA